MEFSVNMLTTGGQRLRDLERAAKQQKTGIWTNYVPVATNQGKLSDSFAGKVGEYRNDKCLVIHPLPLQAILNQLVILNPKALFCDQT